MTPTECASDADRADQGFPYHGYQSKVEDFAAEFGETGFIKPAFTMPITPKASEDAFNPHVAPKTHVVTKQSLHAWQIELEELAAQTAKQVQERSCAPVSTDAEEAMLKDAAKNGYGLRTTMGVRFGRSVTGTSAEYKQASRHGKAAMRMDWADGRLAEYRAVNIKSEGFEEVDESDGQYLPLSLIFWEEGQRGVSACQDYEAVEAGMMHAKMCCQMGGKFLRTNPMTERTEFLHLRKHLRERFFKKWQKTMQERNAWAKKTEAEEAKPRHPFRESPPEAATQGHAEAANQGHAEDTAENTPELPVKATPETKVQVTPKSSPAKPPKRDNVELGEGGTPAEKQAKPDIESLIHKSQKLKGAYHMAVSVFNSLNEALEKDAAWDWADAQTKKGLAAQMHTAKAQLDREMTAFMRKVLTTDIKILRREHEETYLASELTNWCKMFSRIDELAWEAKVLVKIGSARTKEQIIKEVKTKKLRKGPVAGDPAIEASK
jgi:hypothetical protein